MKRLNIFLLMLATLFVVSCDEVEFPVETTTNDPGTGGGVVLQKILIEDFTGQGCQGCPAAADKAKELHDLFPDQVIVAGVHAGWFASGPGNPYTDLFSTQAGEDYLTIGGINFFPNGYVNRVPLSNDVIVNHNNWGAAIDQLKDLEPTANVEISTTLNAGNNSVEISVTTTALKDITGDHTLVIYFMEDKVVAPQTFPGGASQSDYEHPHVLRDVINGTWGENLISGAATMGETFTKTMNYTIDQSWDVSKCSVIAYVRNASTEEIIQVEEVKLME